MDKPISYNTIKNNKKLGEFLLKTEDAEIEEQKDE